ncbi:DUF885 family protein [Candidatus Bipolaricaulota bacterium]
MTKWLLPAIALAVLAGLVLFIPPRPEPLPAQEAQTEVPQTISAASATSPPEQLSEQPEQPLDEFLNEASLAVVLRYPETITSLGISSMIGVRDDQLAPLSEAYELETIALLDSLLSDLARYDLSSALPADALSAKVYGWYLEDLRDSLRFATHEYLVSSFIHSVPTVFERFLTRSHPVRTVANAQDYLSRLEQLSLRFDELMVRLAANEAIGAVPPRSILIKARDAIQQMSESQAEETIYYTAFSEKLAQAPSIQESDIPDLVNAAAQVIESSVLPAYGRLAGLLTEQAERVDESIGVWRHAGGDEYYAHTLNKHTTTNLTADEIHGLGLTEVARLRDEIAAAMTEFGIDSLSDLRSGYEQLRQETGVTTGQEMIPVCQELINEIEGLVRPAFTSWPTSDIEVVAGQTSAFFSPGTLDGTRPGRFFAPVAREEPTYGLPTLTYHEAIPGHGLQTAFSYTADIPIYRAGLGFSGYSEGWALYAERLAWELGAYEEDSPGNLGRLQAEIFRAVRLVVDTGIHAKRWTMSQAVEYFIENTGMDEAFAQQEVERYVVLPGQAAAYKVGMLAILDLRDRAERELGEAFDLAEFHQAVLGEGDVPLLILQELVDAYITEAR